MHFGFAIILFGREEPLAVLWVYLQFVNVVFPCHTHYFKCASFAFNFSCY